MGRARAFSQAAFWGKFSPVAPRRGSLSSVTLTRYLPEQGHQFRYRANSLYAFMICFSPVPPDATSALRVTVTIVPQFPGASPGTMLWYRAVFANCYLNYEHCLVSKPLFGGVGPLTSCVLAALQGQI